MNDYKTSTFDSETINAVETRGRIYSEDLAYRVREGKSLNPDKKIELANYPQFKSTDKVSHYATFREAHDLCKRLQQKADEKITYWVPSVQGVIDDSKMRQELGIRVSISRFPIQREDGEWGMILCDIGAPERFYYVVESKSKEGK